MKDMKVVVPVEIDKVSVQHLSEELGNTRSVFLTAFILDILDKVHEECVETGNAVHELDRFNPCQLWPKVGVKGGGK